MRKLQIEPLEKARWDRIERELRDRLEHEPASGRQVAGERDARSRPLFALVLAGAAAVVVGGLAWEKLHTGTPVAVHAPAVARVETQDAPSHVELGGATLEVGAHSAARIDGNDETGLAITLDHGSVECEVAPRHGRPPFVVRSGDVEVRVVGTHFVVDREGGATHVTVQRGVVEVESHGTTTRVAAGSAWPETAMNAPEPRPSAALTDTPLVRSAPKPQASAPIAAETATAPSTPSPRERYDRAITLEASRPDEALSIYRDLAAGDGSWAMNALYAEARLELERGEKDSARKLFAEYLRRYPSGPNANDARELSAKLQ